ncbi:MAG: trimethylamine methyltransferase family protein [Dehalococcoidia bacterium]|nr:trimethylamine methyltransferase family protein [Dehalococcoidia bacterium]
MPRPSIDFLSQEEVKTIHNASLKILEETGVKAQSKKALDILKQGGANIDYDAQIARIPPGLVKKALELAPKTIKLCARNPKYDFVLDKRQPHYTTTGYAALVMDLEDGKRRRSTNKDLADWLRVADYLNNVGVNWASLTPTEVPAPMQTIVETVTLLNSSEKHAQTEALNATEARYEIEIAATVAGGREELKKRPVMSALQSPISPLAFEQGSIEAVIEFAGAGIPVVHMTMPLIGETAPATIAGILVVSNAETLASIVIAECASAGAPAIYSSAAASTDFKTGCTNSGAPERFLIHMGLTQLAHYYQIPAELVGAATDSKIADVQSGYEKGMDLAMILLMGPELIVALGGLDASNAMGLEMLVIDNEIINAARRLSRGCEINDDTLALDIIHKVGPRGQFLGQKHTLSHYKTEVWLPELSAKGPFAVWEKAGSKPLNQVANEKAKQILATHKPEPIPADEYGEISRILNRAEAELLK